MPATDTSVLFLQITLIVTLSAQVFLYFIYWPSWRNLVVIERLPITLIAFIAGSIFLVEPAIKLRAVTEEHVRSLTLAMMIGVVPLFLGFHLAAKERTVIPLFLSHLQKNVFEKTTGIAPMVWLAVTFMCLLSIALYLYAYRGMGFIPAFAEDPIAAKYLAGEYFDRYKAYAAPYRLAMALYLVTFPFLIILLFSSRNPRRFLLLLVVIPLMVLTLFTLRRSLIAFPILSTLLILAVHFRGGRYTMPAAILYLFVFAFGSAVNDIAYYLLGIKDDLNLLSIVAGAPDMADLLWFWQAWMDGNAEHSLGRTIFGGLVPFHYEWKPAVVTKHVIGAESTAVSGGFRLPPIVWGYVSYGFPGAVLWGFHQGLVAGLWLRMMRAVLEPQTLSLTMRFTGIIFAQIVQAWFQMILAMNLDGLVILVVQSVLLFLCLKDIAIFPHASRQHRTVVP